jgi:hypothetical protein
MLAGYAVVDDLYASQRNAYTGFACQVRDLSFLYEGGRRGRGVPGNPHSRKMFVQDTQIILLLPGLLPLSGPLPAIRLRQNVLEGF